jgi:hypothetical protein
MATAIELAVATHARLMVVTLDATWQLRSCQVLATGHHYGIALPDGSGRQFWAKSNDQALTCYEQRADGWTATGMVPFRRRVGYVHQIAHANGGLYIANTTYNSVVYQDDAGQVEHEYPFYGCRDGRHHVNSVYPGPGVVLVLLHNKGREPSQAVLCAHTPTTGFRPLLTLGLGHFGCHNVFVDEHSVYYNASQAGRLVVVNRSQPAIVRELVFPGHVKGLAATTTHLIIGYSDHAPRHRRIASQGYLAVIDRATLEAIATVDLNTEGPVGNVNEVRCLSSTDHAHATTAATLPNLSAFCLLRETFWQRHRRLLLTALRRRLGRKADV